MKIINKLPLILLLAALVISPASKGSPAAVFQEKPAADDKAPDPVQELRNRFTDTQADEATLAIVAGDLIKAKDQEWLRSKLLDAEFSLKGKTIIVSAFWVKKDISVLEEMLVFSVSDENKEIHTRCVETIHNFLWDKNTRGPSIKKLLKICQGENISEPLLLGALRSLGGTWDPVAMDLLISFLTHANPALKDEAVRSLTKLTGQQFGEDQAAWKSWWDKNRHLPSGLLVGPIFSDKLKKAVQEIERMKARNMALAFRLIKGNPSGAVEFLAWEEASVRREAARVIAAYLAQNPSQEILEKVIAHFETDEQDEETLKPLLETVGRAGSDLNGKPPPPEQQKRCQALLIARLRNDARDSIKVKAANGLKGYKNPEVHRTIVEILQGLKEEKNRNVLKEALLDLVADFGSSDDVDLVKDFLAQSHDKAVREEAVKALGASGSEAAIDILAKTLLEESDTNIHYEVTLSLMKLGKHGTPENGMKEKAVSVLRRFLRAHEINVRGGAIRSIGALNPPDGITIIGEHIVWETDLSNLGWCAWALGLMKNPAGFELILNVLSKAGQENGANVDTVTKARNAIMAICVDNQDLWLQVAQIFFDQARFDMVAWCCDEFFKKGKGQNGSNGVMKRLQALEAEAKYELSLKAKDIPGAVVQARKLADKIDPANNEYLLKLARVLARSKETLEEAAEKYKTLIDRFPADQAAELWLIKVETAECFLAKGDANASLSTLLGYPGEATKDLSEELLKRMEDVKKKADALLEKEKEPEGKPAAGEEPPESGGGTGKGAESKASEGEKKENKTGKGV